MKKIIYILFALSMIAITRRHECHYKLCPMKGQYTFKGCGECEEGGDCWYSDKTHWEHPTWTSEQIDDYVFKTIPNSGY